MPTRQPAPDRDDDEGRPSGRPNGAHMLVVSPTTSPGGSPNPRAARRFLAGTLLWWISGRSRRRAPWWPTRVGAVGHRVESRRGRGSRRHRSPRAAQSVEVGTSQLPQVVVGLRRGIDAVSAGRRRAVGTARSRQASAPPARSCGFGRRRPHRRASPGPGRAGTFDQAEEHYRAGPAGEPRLENPARPFVPLAGYPKPMASVRPGQRSRPRSCRWPGPSITGSRPGLPDEVGGDRRVPATASAANSARP